MLTRLGPASWLLVHHVNHSGIWLHQILVSHGVTETAWFSAEEWQEGGDGQVLPY